MTDLTYDGVSLRRISREDLPKLFAWRNDPRVYQTCRQCEPLHWANHEKWFDAQSQDETMSMFVVTAPQTEPIGVAGLTGIDPINRRAEFSLYIGPEFQGEGFGSKALVALFNYGFMVRGMNVIWGETFDGNPAASLFEALGMKKEGARRDFYYRSGSFINAHLYSITRKEWDKRAS